MNYRMVFNVIGRMIRVVAILMLLPAGISFIYGEQRTLCSFLITVAIALGFGTLVTILVRPKNQVIYAKEGFAIVVLGWVCFSAVGALPFVLSGNISNYIDAFFETVSGFTTTGASILNNVEALSKGALFWRSFTHWIGGMGVLVFVAAVIPNLSDRSIHILKAEMPGPVFGKLVPRLKDTAKILYLIYIAMTVIEFLMLWIGGMPAFDSIVHTFGTAGTGGFGIKSDSIAGYSNYHQWVIAVFMMLFGINFNLYYLFLIGRIRTVLRSTELWVFIGLITVSTGAITLNILPEYPRFSEAIRHAYFQVASIMSTSGFSTADFNLWPELSKGLIFFLMFLGACAGSTAGGLKISRSIMLVKMVGAETRRLLHPRSVSTVRFEGKAVDETTLKNVSVYFAFYIICIFAVFLLICFEPFGIESNFSAAVTCFNNVGPGLGEVGPASSFADYSFFSKLVLSAAMLLGRLEIFPVIIAFSLSTWTKRG